MARVKFIRDEEPNIRSLETNGGVIDGALYVATDTGTMWMGTGTSTLLQIKDNINTDALKGATSSADGAAGYAPAPVKGSQNSFLRGDATWQAITKSTVGLGSVDNTADKDKSVKYATSAGSANTASVANSVAWDNVTGAPTIPDVDDYVKHEAINEYVTPDNKLNASLIAGTLGTNQIADGAITKAKIASGVIPAATPIATVSTAGKVKPDGKTITIASDGTISGASTYTLPAATESTLGGVYANVNSSAPNFVPLGSVFSQKGQGLVIGNINDGAIDTRNLANDAVTADKLASNAVTADKIADGVITADKLTSNAVTKAKLGSDVPITYSSTTEPTASDGKNGDVWIMYEE